MSSSLVIGDTPYIVATQLRSLECPSRQCLLIHKLKWEVVVDQSLGRRCHAPCEAKSKGSVLGVRVAEGAPRAAFEV